MEDDFGMLNDFGKRLSKLDAQKKNRFYAILQGLTYDFCKKYKVTIDVFNDDTANCLFAVAFERGQTRLLKDVMKALEEFEKPLDDDDVRKLLKRVLTIMGSLIEKKDKIVIDTFLDEIEELLLK